MTDHYDKEYLSMCLVEKIISSLRHISSIPNKRWWYSQLYKAADLEYLGQEHVTDVLYLAFGPVVKCVRGLRV